ncbi:MAG: nuclear transport factor 2 family protein [Hyphomicrobiaceae bacterium]|nr:nuclear transport factor 2 family protein [Hyphomicrobiaceae bacterium]
MAIQTALEDRTDDEVLAAGATEISLQDARALVRLFAEVTTSQDVDAFVSGFTEECVVHFAPAPLIHGREALRHHMATFFTSQRRGFVCKKSLRALNGNVLGVTWTNRWTDASTGKAMGSYGTEFWILRGNLIARWDAASAAFPVD